ncbi:hypothetical protein ACFSCX_03855 [Bacillus salitolerans]|uniref:DUF4625 domain-containing protein n=1 Tax=Bacillus salitolerans TaxID=1437434 RepID=A0ABW4LKF5_9BACI
MNMNYGYILFLLAVLTGCNTDDPNPPEALVIPMEIAHYHEDGTVEASITGSKDVTVRHHVKGKDVYVEVIVPGFTFSSPEQKTKKDGQGFLNLYLNNKKIDEIHQAAFIVKGLPTGKHTLKVELVHNDSSTYGIEREMDVEIP